MAGWSVACSLEGEALSSVAAGWSLPVLAQVRCWQRLFCSSPAEVREGTLCCGLLAKLPDKCSLVQFQCVLGVW